MEPTVQGDANVQQTGQPQIAREVVKVTVAYLPAPKPFHHSYEDETTIGTIRMESMAFFGVSNHKDRDTHEFFLEFEGRRLSDLGETLEKLLGPHRREAHFNLVEQVTQGATSE